MVQAVIYLLKLMSDREAQSIRIIVAVHAISREYDFEQSLNQLNNLLLMRQFKTVKEVDPSFTRFSK